MVLKNTASKVLVFAFDRTTGAPKTGDAANITAYMARDFGTVTVLGDTSATERDATNEPGVYAFDTTAAEMNGDVLEVSGKSSTSNVTVLGWPPFISTVPQTGILAPGTAGYTLALDSSGRVTVGSIVNGAIAAATFAANALDAVWATTTRLLSAGTNIVLAKGVGLTGLNDVSTADVATATQTGLTAQGYTTTRADYLDTLNGLVAAIWASATRVLTAGTNIALAKGVGVTGFNDITAADVWAAGTRTLSSFGTLTSDTATAVWASATRSLTSFGTLAADAATAVWASATRTLTAFGFGVTVTTNNDKADYILTTDYDAAMSAAQAGDAMTLTSGERDDVADAVRQRPDALYQWPGGEDFNIETFNRVVAAGAGAVGKVSGAVAGSSSTVTVRSIDDTKDVLVDTVDANGNRTGITVDPT